MMTQIPISSLFFNVSSKFLSSFSNFIPSKNKESFHKNILQKRQTNHITSYLINGNMMFAYNHLPLFQMRRLLSPQPVEVVLNIIHTVCHQVVKHGIGGIEKHKLDGFL